LNEKWLYINEEIIFGDVISCIKITELKILGNYTHRLQCKWEKQVQETVQDLEK